MDTRRSIRSVVHSLGLVAVVAGAGVLGDARIAAGEPKAPIARSGVEMQFMDSRIPADERQVLDSAVGYSLPGLIAGAEWVGENHPDLGALRGQVIVIQSFSRAESDGRAAMRRVPEIIDNLKLDGVTVIGLHTPEEAQAAADFFEKKPPETPTILDRTGAYCDELGVYTRPVTILVDRAGRIRYSGVAIGKLRAAVELLAAEKVDASLGVPEKLPPRSTRLDEGGPAGANAGKPGNASAKRPPYPSIKSDPGSARDVRGRQGPSLKRLYYVNGEPQFENKVLMVEFWATWCRPCVANIPHMNELHDKFADTVTVVGVSDEDEPTVRTFMKSKGMKYTVAVDQGGTIKSQLSVRGIPYAIVMSPDGIVRWQGHPAGLDEATVQQIVDAAGVDASSASPSKPKRWVTTEG